MNRVFGCLLIDKKQDKERTMAEQDELVFGAPAGTVSAAAAMAAAEYEDDAEKQIEVITAAWKAKLEAQTKEYMKAAALAEAGVTELEATPVGTAGYQWWNLYVAGPVQAIAPGGPFLPHKIIKHGERAWILCVLWRNPVPIFGVGPSAAVLMGPYTYSVNFESGNLTNWVNGPDFGPITGTFGPGFVNAFWVELINIPAPPEGKPHLYEINVTVDLTTTPGVPFAGYSTWVFDPDTELPFLGLPGVGPQWQHDIPVRVLVYKE
jgi:hypothetical protein